MILKKFMIVVALVALCLMSSQEAQAIAAAGSNFRVIYNFDGVNGCAPYGHLIAVDGRLYGMTAGDHINNMGMIFSIAPDGSDYTILRHFEGKAADPDQPGDGQWPHGSLLFWNDLLYGITWAGGCVWNLCDNQDNTGCGTLFSLKPDGSDYNVFWRFSCGNGDEGLALPNAHFVSDGNRLYSTASVGGPYGFPGGGGVFAIQPDGTGFDILHLFDENNTDEGYEPTGGLALKGDYLYGTTYFGGAYDQGTVFSIRTDGSDFTTLHHFSGPDGASSGSTPVLVNCRLYGVTMFGGANNNGVVFSMRTDGSDFRVLHDFTVNESGPMEGLIPVGDRLYGATSGNGMNDTYGVIYSLRMDGSDYTVHHQFDLADGSWVDGRLLLVGNTLYGLASHGGTIGCGTIFAFDLSTPISTPWWLSVKELLSGCYK